MKANILITGGAGFIGSHLIRFFLNKYPDYNIYNLDLLTYAGNLDNLKDVVNNVNYHFIKEDIINYQKIKEIYLKYNISHVIHLAAESHVDRSIKDPFSFASTNVMGTLSLLQAAKEVWKNSSEKNLFYHVSTDEVYGSLENEGFFTENTKYDPRSPYSASKASSDHFVRAFSNTYGLPVIISNCSNNYGPSQHPEKLIPLTIYNVVNQKLIPVYGKGQNVRDWLNVNDHICAIDLLFHEGKIGDSYNIGGSNEYKNIDLVKLVIRVTDKLLCRENGESNKLINYVSDRPGHDFRYAIDSNKIMNQLGWKPKVKFEDGIEQTVKWYLKNSNLIK